MAKLSEEDAKEVIRLLSEGRRQVDIATRFNVHYSTISLIARCRKWKHLSRAKVAAAILLTLAVSTLAQDAPVSTPPEYALTTGSTTLITSGPKREYFTARFALRVFTDKRTTAREDERDSIRLRATLTATQDGGAVALGDPTTFQSVVPEIEYRKALKGSLQAAAFANVTFSAEGGESAPLDARMFGAFIGVRGALANGAWLFAGAGRSGPVGPEIALAVRGGRPVGKGDAAFEYILPMRADALRNKAWVLQLTTTYQVARGEVR